MVSNGHGLDTLDDLDGFEDEGGDEPGSGSRLKRLAGLDTAAIRIGGRNDGADPGSEYAYSAIIRHEQKIDMSIVWNYTRNYRPGTHAGRMIVNNLTSGGRRMIAAAVNRRGELFDSYEAAVERWERRMGKDSGKQMDQVKAVLLEWTRGMNMQTHIRCNRLMHGLASVEDLVEDWYLAERRIRESETQAIKELTTEGYQVFVSRLEQHKILREEAEDRARHIVIVDLSDWLTNVKGGEASLAEISLGAPWMIQEACIFAMEHHDKDNPYWEHLERLQSGAVAAQQMRRSRWFGGGGGGHPGNQMPAGQPQAAS